MPPPYRRACTARRIAQRGKQEANQNKRYGGEEYLLGPGQTLVPGISLFIL